MEEAMQLENLRKQDIVCDEDDYKLSIEFDHVERHFTDTDRNHVLYSRVQYKTDDFVWDAVLPTVEIPYRDPSMGFMINGVVFSSVGIYQRAPGVVLGKESDGADANRWVDIVTARNSTIGIGYKRDGIQIEFRKGGHDKRVPIGVFLKAYTGLPYSVILDKFKYKPPVLLNSFPCEVSGRSVKLSSVECYGVNSDNEPNIEDCIDAVYSAILQNMPRQQNTKYSSHWKANRIKSYFNGLRFKTVQNCESTLSVHSRALHTYLNQDLSLRVFNDDGGIETIEYPRGTFVDEGLADFLQWHDIHSLRVTTSRPFFLQEEDPMLFRAVGFKLVSDIPEVQGHAGDIIDKDMCKRLNDTNLRLIEVSAPDGQRVLSRSGSTPVLGDFVTILNLLFTSSFVQHDHTSQYEIANRIVVNYDKQVAQEVEQTYQDIALALGGAVQLSGILESLPRLPSTRLRAYLRDTDTKELAQADNTNIMSRAIAERRASAGMRETPAAMTAVQKGQYARIDSLHSPESDKIGSVQEITAMARLNTDTGDLEAPYEVVVDGVPTGRIEYISAAKENNKYIADWNDDLSAPNILVRYNGNVTTVDRTRVDYRDASPFCDMSISRMTIPFPEFCQPRRSLMATKMNGQAVPLIHPERPLVSTGADTEVPCLYYTARQIVSSCLGEDAIKEGKRLEVVSVKWVKAFADYTCIYDKKSFTFSVPFMATDKKSLYNYNLNYVEGYLYGLDDIVFFNQSCDMGQYERWERVKQGALPLIKDFGKPCMALGTNLVVMFKTFGSSTVDDGVVISDSVIADQKLTNIQIIQYDYELKVDESFTMWDTVPKLHSWVYTDQPVIKVLRGDRKKSKNLEKYIYADQAGEVIYTEVNESERKVAVWVSTIHDPTAGDKVAGRHGNKSVIARIVPACDMPYDPETGETAQIICSPLGIPSRMNYGLVIEMTLGAAMRVQGKCATVTPFYPGIKEDVMAEAQKCGIREKRLYLPTYGKFTERPVMIGTMYFMKLEQMANLKYSAVGYPRAVDPIFGQPVKSANEYKGQELGEMETWSLIAAGANKTLNSLFTLYAPDEQSREDYFKMLADNPDKGGDTWDEHMGDIIKYRKDRRDAVTTQTVVRMFGLDIDAEAGDSKFHFVPLNFDDIPVTASLTELKNHNEPTEDGEWCKVKLQAPVVNPFWIHNFPLKVVLGIKSVQSLVDGKWYLNVYDRSVWAANEVKDYNRAAMITGIDAIIALLRNTTIDQAIERLTKKSGSEGETGTTVVLEANGDDDLDELFDVPSNYADIVRFLRRMKASGLELADLVWEYMPIMPKVFRQTSIVNGVERERSFQKQLRHICECSRSSDIYSALLKFVGYGENHDDDLISVRGYFFGKDSKSGSHGTIRGNVLSKRIGFSGRTVIVPAADTEMSPFCIGVPWCVVLTELSKVLAIRLRNRASALSAELRVRVPSCTFTLNGIKPSEWEKIIESLWQYNPYVFEKYFATASEHERIVVYNLLRETIKSICEVNASNDGRVFVNGEWLNVEDVPDDATIDAMVVMVGRQPTLHKRSIRVFFGRLVDGFSLHIHPLVCSGFNADFDGDQMWNVQIMGEMKNEAWHTLSYLQDLVSEKDGTYTIAPTQDTVLGLYSATIFKDNTAEFQGRQGQFYVFDDKDELRTALERGDLSYYDIVEFKYGDAHYLSTAGRMLVNLVVPGAMTKLPFTDKWGICKQVLGEEYIGLFNELRYDTVWVSTGIKPQGRESTVKIEQVLISVYREYGNRKSLLVNQELFEIGIAASDIYSVTTSINDLTMDVNLDDYMEEPRNRVAQLNTLEQMGLVSEQERKDASARAWESARKTAMDAVITAIPADSNMHMMLYSGARGKPDQIMQAVGFIGSISKTATEDIEYPILKGYGAGLSAIDLCQTRETARIGVVSTQAGTKDTGYSTRQTVYMSSGMRVAEEDCGIEMCVSRVPYSVTEISVMYADGHTDTFESLVGKGLNPDDENSQMLDSMHPEDGFVISDDMLSSILVCRISTLSLTDGSVKIQRHIQESWRQRVLNEGYSYALPFTENRKITEKSLNWVCDNGLSEIVMFDKEVAESGDCFNNEAYLPVDYDKSKYTLTLNGVAIGDEAVYGRIVSKDSERFWLYSRLLDSNGGLTVRALRYLTKKGVRSVKFENEAELRITYAISALFKSLVLGRVSAGLPHLDSDDCITAGTLVSVEEAQLEAIPVRTSLTCMCECGMCVMCTGKTTTTGMFSEVGADLGISAAQAQCEPLSQSTLNVTHSGGKRSAGVGLVSGLSFYMKMLKAKLVSEKNKFQLEAYAKHSGYVRCNQHDDRFFDIVDVDGKVLESWELDNAERLNVPDGAYVDGGDTIRTGLPVLDRYSSHDIFQSCLQTRYLLLREYYRIFKALSVSPRNYEVLAREQTSICYLDASVPLPSTQDTSVEIKNPTGKYVLRVAPQADVVNKYSGIAGFAFEDVASMLCNGVLNDSGLSLNSALGNIVTGTDVGSTELKFIPRNSRAVISGYRKSAVREATEKLKTLGDGRVLYQIELGTAPEQSAGAIEEASSSLLNDLVKAEQELGFHQDWEDPMALPESEVEVDSTPLPALGQFDVLNRMSLNSGAESDPFGVEPEVEPDSEVKPSYTLEITGSDESDEPEEVIEAKAYVLEIDDAGEDEEDSEKETGPKKPDHGGINRMKHLD